MYGMTDDPWQGINICNILSGDSRAGPLGRAEWVNFAASSQNDDDGDIKDLLAVQQYGDAFLNALPKSIVSHHPQLIIANPMHPISSQEVGESH